MNEVLSNAAMWAIIVGAAQPPILSLIMRVNWSDQLKALVAFAVSIVTGTGTAYFTGQFTGLSVVSSILLVAVVSIAAYKGFWKPTGTSPSIQKMSNGGTE